MSVRTWRCRRVKAGVACGTLNLRIKQRCTTCGGPRPKPRKPPHRAVLDAMPYDAWIERFGERCGICGAEPSSTRRLDRDHDHATGEPRGLLCHLCNRTLGPRITASWLRAAAAYLERERGARS